MNINLDNYSSIDTKTVQPVKADPKDKGILNREISLFKSKFGMKEKEQFYTSLEILLKAGLDIKTSLELIVENETKTTTKDLLTEIKEDVVNGASFSDAVSKQKYFSNYEIFSLKIAEESGKLNSVLLELSDFYSKNLQYKRMMLSALSYPITVITVAILALVFLLNFMIPMFGDIYSKMGQELPVLTQYMIKLSSLSITYMPYFLLVIILLIIISYSQKDKEWFRKSKSIIISRIPIIGPILIDIYLARFNQAMGFLLQSKVPLLNATELVQKMISFYPIERSLDSIQQKILEGSSFQKAIEPFKIFPNNMKALLRVGEESNQMDQMFLKLAAQSNKRIEQKTKMLNSLIEPIMIVVLAVVVGLVLVSMYLPIFNLVTNVGK